MKEVALERIGDVQVSLEKARNGPYMVLVTQSGLILDYAWEGHSRKEGQFQFRKTTQKYSRMTKKDHHHTTDNRQPR